MTDNEDKPELPKAVAQVVTEECSSDGDFGFITVVDDHGHDSTTYNDDSNFVFAMPADNPTDAITATSGRSEKCSVGKECGKAKSAAEPRAPIIN